MQEPLINNFKKINNEINFMMLNHRLHKFSHECDICIKAKNALITHYGI